MAKSTNKNKGKGTNKWVNATNKGKTTAKKTKAQIQAEEEAAYWAEQDRLKAEEEAERRKEEEEAKKPKGPTLIDQTIRTHVSNIDKYRKNELNFADDLDRALLSLDLPIYSVEDYINDRNNFLKGIRMIGDELGWFYFKIFFKFDTSFGLFGGVLKPIQSSIVGNSTSDFSTDIYPTNSALGYLWAISNFYKSEKIADRLIALHKFVNMLSDIANNSPWFFKGVNGLATVMGNYVDEFSKDKVVELLLADERADMRIGTLLNLYKYLCYDDINCKEILPENLRKFEMQIALFHVPIKYFQTGILINNQDENEDGGTQIHTINYKTMFPVQNSFSNMFSFKIFSFLNCEFDIASFSKYLEGSQINNEKAFNLGTGATLTIKYDRVYYHEMNEWNQFMFGSTGFHFNQFNDEFKQRLIKYPTNFGLKRSESNNAHEIRKQALLKARENSYFDLDQQVFYKSLIDYSEAVITDGLKDIEIDVNSKFNEDTRYFKKKLKYSMNESGGFFSNLLDSIGLGRQSSYGFGNIYGRDMYDYYQRKIQRLKGKSVQGNLYSKNFEGYNETKFNHLKRGSISGNIYGRVFNSNKGERSPYLDQKLENLTKQKDLGNVFGQTTNTENEYFITKLEKLKGNIIEGNLYGNLTGEGQVNAEGRLPSNYMTEKLTRLLDRKDLGKINGGDLSPHMANFETSSKPNYSMAKRLNEKIDVTLKINDGEIHSLNMTANTEGGPKPPVNSLDIKVATPDEYKVEKTINSLLNETLVNSTSDKFNVIGSNQSSALKKMFNESTVVSSMHTHKKSSSDLLSSGKNILDNLL
jgi:hypothetical protein